MYTDVSMVLTASIIRETMEVQTVEATSISEMSVNF
jgi:hypothetical protein